MLIRFSVENFLSFKERQAFSMAAGKQSRHSNHIVNVNGQRILKGGYIFGANAAGKSNFIKAIAFAQTVIIKGLNNIVFDKLHFRIDPSYAEKPGVFQFDILAGDSFYSYGFALNYSNTVFESEWLYRINKGSEENIFEREVFDGKSRISTDLKLGEEENRFNIYAEDVKDSILFLQEINSKNISSKNVFRPFLDIWNWFDDLVVVFPDYHFSPTESYFSNIERNYTKFLKAFDTGIEKIKVKEVLFSDVLSRLPENDAKSILMDVEKKLRSQKNTLRSGLVDIEGNRYTVMLRDNQIVAKLQLMDHGNENDLFSLSDESDGTQRLFDLIPIIEKGSSRVFVVDELDRSFHSKLIIELINYFYQNTESDKTQLIASMHDTNLMDLEILRQDEIWFAWRRANKSTELYSLNKFQIRFDRNVMKDYLLGRYGSIPAFTQLEESDE